MDNQDLLGSFSLDSHVASQGKAPSGGAGAAPEKAPDNIASSFSLDEPSGVTAQRQQKEQETKTKQYKDTTASDVAKGLGSGIELGAAQIVGLPGDIARAGRYLKEEGTYYGKKALENYGYLPEGTADEDWKAVEEARQSPNRGWVGPLPSSEVTEAAAKKYLPGASYEPESRGGAYAHTIGEFVPTILGGEGSAIKKLGTAAIAGAGSEAAGQATEGTPYEGIARIGGALVSPFAAEKTLSRPLGSVGSALGVSDQALGAVGLKSGNMAAYDKLVSEGSRLSKLGVLGGLSEDNIKAIVEQEMRDGVRPSDSIITSASALSDSPSDIVRAFIKNSSLENPKVRAEVQKLVGNVGRASDTADMTATRILNDMQDEASVNALNAHRLVNGLPADITEAPTANKLRSVADEVKDGAWDRLVQPTYDDHKAVNNDLIFDKLTKVGQKNPDLIFDAQELYNSRLENRGENPVTFLTKDQNGTYKNFGYVGDNGTVKGAPLEFLDILQRKLYQSNDETMQLNAKKIKEGIDQYFTQKGLPNELQAAKDAHGDIRSQGNAITAGMNFISDGAYQTNPSKRRAFLGRWNNLDDVEKGLYQAGVLHQIKETLGQGQQGYKNWNKVLQNADNRQLLQEILNFRPKGAPAQVGPSNYERFSNALDVAQAFKKEHVNNILMSTPESRTFLGRILGMGDRSLFDVMLHTAYRGAFSPELGTITALSGGLGYIRQVFADRRALKMLQMFNSKDPQFAMQLARDIATHKEAKTSWQKVKALLDFTDKATINFYRRAAVAANNQQPQQRKEGGRVDNDADGFIPHNDPKRQKNLEAFKPIKDEKGNPRVFYHGTNKNFDVFGQGRSHPLFRPQRFHFVSPNPEIAGVFAHDRDSSHIEGNYPGESAQNIMPVHVSAKNPWDYENPDHVSALMSEVVKRQPGWSPEEADQMHHYIHTRGGFDFIEDPQQQKIIKDLGHDSFYVHEMGAKNLAVYDPRQIKSATGNSGHFDPSNPDITKAKGGFVDRPKRATGGRIPEVDKLFKAAKKELDNSTKPMLNMHDDHIVNALRIAQGRI